MVGGVGVDGGNPVPPPLLELLDCVAGTDAGVCVALGLDVAVGWSVAVGWAVPFGIGVGDAVAVAVAVGVEVAEGVGLGFGVRVGFGVSVGVGLDVGVGLGVEVAVGDGVTVIVGLGVPPTGDVAVGVVCGAIFEACAAAVGRMTSAIEKKSRTRQSSAATLFAGVVVTIY